MSFLGFFRLLSVRILVVGERISKMDEGMEKRVIGCWGMGNGPSQGRSVDRLRPNKVIEPSNDKTLVSTSEATPTSYCTYLYVVRDCRRSCSQLKKTGILQITVSRREHYTCNYLYTTHYTKNSFTSITASIIQTSIVQKVNEIAKNAPTPHQHTKQDHSPPLFMIQISQHPYATTISK